MKKIFSQKGFTLVELLVAVSIFALVMAVAGGVFVGFVGKQRAQLRQYALQQDIYNFFDMLDREIKTGYGDTFESNSSSELSFFNQSENRAQLNLNSKSSYQLSGKAIQYLFGSDVSTITSKNTEVEGLKFTISNGTLVTLSDGTLGGSPMRVTVSIHACPKDRASDNECMDVQTTITCRQVKPHPENP